ncbi:efflux RND transporter periplasmic adaptor subunit [Marinicella sediminis]|uniref:Efflux RND transporter periplasmic adaptor subunit n=1 Tax=Marinicella sediminis TaxID=1792834 RepID=A0ABV7JAN0_9GAMM|nr:efflux RND transporter periplasmic adaptor subunit [Marinicella sediminis]
MLKKLIGPVIIIIAVLVVLVMIKNKPRPETQESVKDNTLKLLTQDITAATHPLLIEAEGFVSSRWQTTLSAEVSGTVIAVSDQFLAGRRFMAGDVLVSLDPLPYEVQLARAQANLSDAETRLVEEQKQAARAEKDWYRINPNREPTDFNLRKPQLKAAENNLLAARQDLRLANDNLRKTRIRAPYDGFSLSRNVDLGEAVQIGTVLGELVAGKQLQVRSSLTTSEASLLEQQAPFKITLTDQSGQSWQATEVRFEPFIDSNNRWRTVIIELENDRPAPVYGAFLQVMFSVQNNQPLMKIPETAISIDGSVWYILNGLTAKLNPQVIYQRAGHYYIQPPNETDKLELISSPPNSLTSGIPVVSATETGE